jgi:hypothetical protein
LERSSLIEAGEQFIPSPSRSCIRATLFVFRDRSRQLKVEMNRLRKGNHHFGAAQLTKFVHCKPPVETVDRFFRAKPATDPQTPPPGGRFDAGLTFRGESPENGAKKRARCGHRKFFC